MRLGLDLLFLIPGESGGRETYARELLSSMLALEPGLDITAFANRELGAGLVSELGAALRVVRLPVSARRPDQWALGEIALLPVAARRAGVEVLHSPANFAPVSGRFRRVVTMHDLQYRAVPELLTPARRIGTAAMLRGAARRADRIVTGSAFGRDELIRELSVAAERIEVIPHGLGRRVVASPSDESELRRRHRLGARSVALAVAGDLPHKNLGALIEALVGVSPERRPVVVFAGSRTDGPALRERAKAAGLLEDVRLLGFQPEQELEGLYRLAACVVLPSLYEGFGLPVLEAMSRGVPVACSDIPAHREVAGEAALYFGAGNAAELAAAITRLIEDGALRKQLIQSGHRRAAGFSWERAARATLACYRQALAGAV